MKAAIFSLLPVRRGSTIASVRIGRWLSDLLGVPLFDDQQISEMGDLDVLFIINGSTLYCKHLEELAESVRRADQVVWIQNDYTLPPPKAESSAQSPFRRAFADRKLVPHYWTTCEENEGRTSKSAWVNWNVLGFKMDAPRASLSSNTAIYYGAFRENRTRNFEHMLDCFKEYEIEVSSTSAKFHEGILIPPFREDLHASLSEYGLGIYTQDAKSANARHSPATRFYEMLSVGLPMVFTGDCVQTLKRYGYVVEEFILSLRTVDRLITDRKSIAERQQAEWARDYESGLASKVRRLYATLDR